MNPQDLEAIAGRTLEHYDRNAEDFWQGFVELAHYYRPSGLPPERQPWLASAWRLLHYVR